MRNNRSVDVLAGRLSSERKRGILSAFFKRVILKKFENLALGLIVFMAYAVFWLDPTLIGTQIGVATSTVFTLIAYNFALSDILPRISYLTRADFFLVGCMFLVFGALGEAVLTGVLAQDEDRLMLARRIDVLARVIYPLCFALILLVAFL